MTDQEKIQLLTRALKMAQAEMVTLRARLSGAYERNVGLVLDEIKETLRKVAT